MKILWTPQAAFDLQQAADFIAKDKPDAASHFADRIYQRVMSLQSTPYIGRLGVVPGTLELAFPPWQWIVVYKVGEHAIKVLKVRHTSRRLPGSTKS